MIECRQDIAAAGRTIHGGTESPKQSVGRSTDRSESSEGLGDIVPDEIIENPILNSPFQMPQRHFKFTEDGITNEIVEARRLSGYFIPIPQPKKKGKQLVFDSEWTQDRFRESEFINRIRDRVNVWRAQGWPGTTNTSTRLLRHWSDPIRERRLFFCQIEALETAIYLTEVADKVGDAWIANNLRETNKYANAGTTRRWIIISV